MSLLNDVLQDLSKRPPVADGSEGYDELLQSSSVAKPQKASSAKLVWLFIIIFASVLAINVIASRFATNRPTSIAAQDNSSQITQLPNSAAAISSAASANVPAPTAQSADVDASTEITSDDPVNIELQNHIDDLLLQAERAMGMERLTAPIEDNAYSYYQKILAMSPDNVDAKDGLDKIASRYMLKAQEQKNLGNLVAADALIQRARFVSARFVQAHEITLAEATSSFSADFSADAPAKSEQALPAELSAKEGRTETIKPFEVAEAKSVSVVPNAGWKDEQLAIHAQELISKDKQEEALNLLKNFVASEKSPALSAAVLADLYLQQGNPAAANIIVEQITYFPADVKAKLKAQILSAGGEDAQAILILEKHLAAAEANESYRSLLASLYHKTANYQQSVISYQRLITSFGEKPAYWLGLALAYDGLAQPQSALQAYQRLRDFPQLQAQVKQYTDQRIAALRSQ